MTNVKTIIGLLVAAVAVVGVVASAAATLAQQVASGGGRGAVAVSAGVGFKITESTPIEVTTVKNAPFAAQAVTEFTQTLGDGNRIERRYQSSVARDSRGRTRREEEIALIGPLATANAAAPRLVTIVDADAGVTYTLDEEERDENDAFANPKHWHVFTVIARKPVLAQ